MRSLIGPFTIVLSLVLLRAPARADGTVLSLDEAVERAERFSPLLKEEEALVGEARATRVGAGLRLPQNPVFSLDGRSGLARESRGRLGYASSLQFTFDVSGAPGARLAEADQRVLATRAEGRVVRLQVRARVLRAYAGASLARLRLVNADEAIAIAERILAGAERRMEMGAGGEIDVASARAELATQRAERLRALSDIDRNERELRFLVDLPGEAPLQLSSDVTRAHELPSLQALETTALQKHPEVQALQTRMDLLTRTEDRLKKEASPKLGTFLGVDSSPESSAFGIFGLSVELPVAQRNQGPRAVAAAERATAATRLDLTRDRLLLDLRTSHAAYQSRRAELRVLDEEGVPAALKRLQLIETGWREGRFDVFRLTTAAHEFVLMKSNRLSVVEQLWLEWISLQTLSGGWSNERS